MIVGRVTKVVNPKPRPAGARAPARRPAQPASNNPAHLVTLGWLNPKQHKRRNAVAKMAKSKKKKTGGPKAAGGGRRNPTVLMIPARQNKKRPKNPMFFGSQVSAGRLATFVVGGLVGVAINKAVLPILPAKIVGSNLGATLAAFALAGLEWWGGSMVDRDFGTAVGFGGLMNAGSQALNAFIPSVGSIVSLSGQRRGVNDLVPARWTIPENPVDTSVAGQGPAMRSAYPAAYALAA